MQDAVARVGGDVGEVVRMEPQIERVRDEAADGGADVGLQVLVMVPGEGGDAVAVLEPELVPQREGELLRAADEVGVRVLVPALVGQSARDRLVALKELLRAPQDGGHVEPGSIVSPCMSPPVAVEQIAGPRATAPETPTLDQRARL
jgi:hypothetical protein